MNKIDNIKIWSVHDLKVQPSSANHPRLTDSRPEGTCSTCILVLVLRLQYLFPDLSPDSRLWSGVPDYSSVLVLN